MFGTQLDARVAHKTQGEAGREKILATSPAVNPAKKLPEQQKMISGLSRKTRAVIWQFRICMRHVPQPATRRSRARAHAAETAQ
ncbi:MAG: hypothetical protein QOG55_2732 [Acidobacteriaceae bacterium]|jgi:hypothetical protein|nr:hypothetical protein [Acidobacteriaceae bacterium]